jgi:peptide/nickel transport system substrate-binding protein
MVTISRPRVVRPQPGGYCPHRLPATRQDHTVAPDRRDEGGDKHVRLKKAVAAFAAGAAVLGTAAACGGGSDNPSTAGGAKQGGRLIYGFETAFMENLFQLVAAGNSVAIGYMLIRVTASPTRYNSKFEVVPDTDLLTGMPTSEMKGGKQVVTYKINPNAVWGDKAPIVADDFEFSWNLQKSSDPAKGGCPDLLSTTGFDQIESVEGADNGKTVTVTYAKPFADWQGAFNSGLFPKSMDKGSPAANCAMVKAGWPVADGVPLAATAGPWQITKANVDVAKQTVTLTPNPNYWGAKPRLDALIYKQIGSEASVNVKSMKSGEIDMIYPQPQRDLVKNIGDLAPAVTSKISFGLSFEHMDFNTRVPGLDDVNVRKAIATAIDRPKVVQSTVAAFDNRAKVLDNHFYVNNQPQYKPNSGGLYDTGDVAKAKQMLETAGYKLGPDGIYAKGSTKLSFDMMTTVQNPTRLSTIQVIASQLKEAGVEIKTDLNPDIFAGAEKPKSLEAGGHQIALFAWVSSPLVSGNISIYKSVVGDAQGQNYAHCNIPKVDEQLALLAVETDPQKQADLANAADTALWEQMCTLPLYQKPVFLAFNSKFDKVDENATQAGPLWDSEVFGLK